MTDELAQEPPKMAPLGGEGELCSSCGAPLAVDQRYCINCGERRAGPRVDYLQFRRPQAASATLPAGASPGVAETLPAAPGPREASPWAAVGGIAILGLMLLVGVLIGRGDGDTAAAPQPVVVEGAADPSATTAETSPGEGQGEAPAAGAEGSGGDAGRDEGGERGGAGDSGGGGGAGAGSPEQPVQASTEDLQQLEAASGEDYAEASEDLPDTIATPGEPPPVDNEAPGAGTEATTIK